MSTERQIRVRMLWPYMAGSLQDPFFVYDSFPCFVSQLLDDATRGAKLFTYVLWMLLN